MGSLAREGSFGAGKRTKMEVDVDKDLVEVGLFAEVESGEYFEYILGNGF